MLRDQCKLLLCFWLSGASRILKNWIVSILSPVKQRHIIKLVWSSPNKPFIFLSRVIRASQETHNDTLYTYFQLFTHIVLAWIVKVSQCTSLSGSLGLRLKDRAACKASWDEAASPPPPRQFRITQRPDSLSRIKSTEVIWWTQI